MRMNFGEYVHVYNVRGVTNNNQSRTVGAIALYSSNNLQGGWYFMSLDSGRSIHRRQWTKLPITDDVIKRVDELAERENQPLISANFKYTWDKQSEHVIEDVETHDISNNDETDFEDMELQDVVDEERVTINRPELIQQDEPDHTGEDTSGDADVSSSNTGDENEDQGLEDDTPSIKKTSHYVMYMKTQTSIWEITWSPDRTQQSK